jgi:hypothetical protein
LGIVAASAVPPLVQPKVIITPSLPQIEEEDGEAMMELEPTASVDLDDDEPSVTIEAAEPTDEEAEAAELSKATPLPMARPLIEDDHTYMMGAEIALPPVRSGPFTVSVPSGSVARPARSTRPFALRLGHSGALRARPSSEGVVALCMGFGKATGPVQRRLRGIAIVDPQRQSATPGPTAGSEAAKLLPPPVAGRDFVASSPLDDSLLAFFRREAARSS